MNEMLGWRRRWKTTLPFQVFLTSLHFVETHTHYWVDIRKKLKEDLKWMLKNSLTIIIRLNGAILSTKDDS